MQDGKKSEKNNRPATMDFYLDAVTNLILKL